VLHGALFMTVEREGAFDLFGPRTLVGPELKPGDPAPDFTLVNSKLQPVSKSDFAGKPLVISVVPSLDTPVCSKQSKRFDEEAANLGDSVSIITVSADLPFAQARWCGANDATNTQTLSDHRDMGFGNAYGTHVKDVRIESRAVFIVDGGGTVRYVEYVPQAGQEPDYASVLQALQQVL
jgi:thiol peroxidase